MKDNVTQRDNVMQDGRWEFDEEVTAAFDDMLSRSIPQHDAMRAACFRLACEYRTNKTAIVDLGCSRGAAISDLVDKFGVHNQFVGVEVSPPMLEAARNKFAGLTETNVVRILDMDLRKEFPPVEASVILSVLTIQFIPIEYRQAIVQRVYDHLIPGGAFIFVEKVLGQGASINETMVELYHRMKRDNGYSEAEIDRKRMALEGVLVPATAAWNADLLHSAGFRHVDTFWRWMNFAGWVAVK